MNFSDDISTTPITAHRGELVDFFGDPRDPGLCRIPPVRHGVKLNYEDGRWGADIQVRHAGRQDRIAAGETPTPGYTLLNASVSYLIVAGRMNYELFARGTNLTDAEAREHISFLKEFAPLPGRGLLAGVRMKF